MMLQGSSVTMGQAASLICVFSGIRLSMRRQVTVHCSSVVFLRVQWFKFMATVDRALLCTAGSISVSKVETEDIG